MGSHRSWRGVSLRVRLLTAGVLVMALGLAAAGASGYALARWNLARAASDQLTLEAREFTTFALEAVDPDTGAPFATASALLRVAIMRRSFGEADGALGVVRDRIEWTAPSGVALRLEDDQALVAEVLQHVAADTTTQGRLAESEHDWSWLVVPVRFPATGETGALVRATDLGVATRQLDNTYRAYAAVSALVVLVSAAIGWWVLGRRLSPIASLNDAASAIGPDDLTTRIPVSGSDDLAALTATINQMLDRIESLVEGQRQLADDIGHELRTPLTVIRGNLDLLDPTDADQVRAFRRLAGEEARSMERLTEDLILLATSDGADFVAPTAADVGQVTREVLALAQGLASRPWQLGPVAEVPARLDTQRIRQAWLQLADNADKYSTPDLPVVIGSEVDGDDVRLWVRDHGPGVAEAERDRITRRAVRGARAVTSGRRGRGLGLAIVTRIAVAHGGRLDIGAAPGGGSVFSIVVPQPPTPEIGDEP